MCYLVAKRFENKGCIAVKAHHGKMLADFTEYLQKQVKGSSIQLVTISRPSAYGEYEPYEIVENTELFKEKVLAM